jgi:hypothetical protein
MHNGGVAQPGSRFYRRVEPIESYINSDSNAPCLKSRAEGQGWAVRNGNGRVTLAFLEAAELPRRTVQHSSRTAAAQTCVDRQQNTAPMAQWRGAAAGKRVNAEPFCCNTKYCRGATRLGDALRSLPLALFCPIHTCERTTRTHIST